jgi:hypothetical protein
MAPEGRTTQLLLRDVNERIARIAASFEATEDVDFVCECTTGCLRAIGLSRDEYEAVRRFPTRFLMKKRHVSRDEERVVEDLAEHVVVEKVGEGARCAVELDPRRRHTLARSLA